MKLGCCTWIFGGEPLALSAARMQRAGLDGMELFGEDHQVIGILGSESRDTRYQAAFSSRVMSSQIQCASALD